MLDDDFPEQFADTLRKAGEALEANGYDVEVYGTGLWNPEEGYVFSGHADTPEEALDSALDDVEETGPLEFRFSLDGDEFRDTVYGDAGIDDVVSRNVGNIVHQRIEGSIEIEEPMTNQIHGRGPDDVRELDYEIPAMPMNISYTPDEDGGYFEVGPLDVHPPYTHEDAMERTDDIITTLEDAGFDAERY